MALEYAHPFDCPYIFASWCDRIFVRGAPAGYGLQGPCWIWTGWNNAKRSGAYGKVWINGRAEYLHRYMWQEHNGLLLQTGDHIDHLCRVRLCFSPYHLECCDLAENNRRRDEYAARYTETHYDPELEQQITEGFGL